MELQTVVQMLRRRVEKARTVSDWCKANQVSQSYVTDVLNGARRPGERMLNILGLETYRAYRRKRNGAAAE